MSQLWAYILEQKWGEINELRKEYIQLNKDLYEGLISDEQQDKIVLELKERNSRIVDELYLQLKQSESRKQEEEERGEEAIHWINNTLNSF